MNKRLNSSKFWSFSSAIVVTVFLAILLACLSTKIKVNAAREQREKQISVICVKEGDTVWSIASEFYTDEYTDLNELVTEIMCCNGISEQIRIGQNIVVPHYQ